jgi:rhodanese-related sulfurtransferase
MKMIVKDFGILALIAAFACGVGLVVDRFRDEPIGLAYRTPAQRLSVPVGQNQSADLSAGPEENVEISMVIEIIDLDRLGQLMEEKRVVIFDVRPNIFFRMGHIPGAHSLQEKEFETDLNSAKLLIDKALEDHKQIIIYCSGTHCSDAGKVAKKLSDLGYGNLMVFESGWEAWQEAGLEEEQESL